MEGGNVPGNVFGDPRHEFGHIAKLLRAIVEPGNDQRHNFQPKTHTMQALDRLQDILQDAAEFAVVAVPKTFKIDLVKVDPWPDVLENFGSAVSVGDK